MSQEISRNIQPPIVLPNPPAVHPSPIPTPGAPGSISPQVKGVGNIVVPINQKRQNSAPGSGFGYKAKVLLLASLLLSFVAGSV